MLRGADRGMQLGSWLANSAVRHCGFEAIDGDSVGNLSWFLLGVLMDASMEIWMGI